MVACAVTRACEVGIDVENLDRSTNLDVARRYFAPAEVAYLETVPEDRQPAVFLRFWTLKEAYVKARGIGLSLPLEQFAFHIGDSASPRIVFEPAMNDDENDWQFLAPNLGSPDHQAAVAVRCARATNLEVEIHTLSFEE
jgi:4'-phosphopantetheinyl transferase